MLTTTAHKRIKPVSSKRARLNRERTKCLDVVKQRSDGWCEARIQDVCTGLARHGHEPQRRVVADITNADEVIHVCPTCHAWIHANEKASYALGLLVSQFGPSFSFKAFCESRKLVRTVHQYVGRDGLGKLHDFYASNIEDAERMAGEVSEGMKVYYNKTISTFEVRCD